jgi:hypothetical protein
MSIESAVGETIISSIAKQFISKEPKRVGDKLVFRRPRAYAVTMFLVGIGLIPLIFINELPKGDELQVLAGMIALTLAAFALGISYAYYGFEVYDDGRIHYRGLWMQKRDFYFVNVESVKADSNGSIIFKLDDGRKAKFDHKTTGEPVMYKLIEQNLPESKYAKLKEQKPKKFTQA